MFNVVVFAGVSMFVACAVALAQCACSIASTVLSERSVLQNLSLGVLIILTVAIFSELDLVLCFLLLVIAIFVCAVTFLYVISMISRCLQVLGNLLVGSGLPAELRVSLGCIELISLWFRAISLSLRLNCNMLAGHALLSIIMGILTANNLLECNLTAIAAHHGSLYLVCAVCGVFGMLKVLTCVIQADVLVRLLGIYWSE